MCHSIDLDCSDDAYLGWHDITVVDVGEFLDQPCTLADGWKDFGLVDAIQGRHRRDETGYTTLIAPGF